MILRIMCARSILYGLAVYKSVLIVLIVHLLRNVNGNADIFFFARQLSRSYDFTVLLADLQKLNWSQRQKRTNT